MQDRAKQGRRERKTDRHIKRQTEKGAYKGGVGVAVDTPKLQKSLIKFPKDGEVEKVIRTEKTTRESKRQTWF